MPGMTRTSQQLTAIQTTLNTLATSVTADQKALLAAIKAIPASGSSGDAPTLAAIQASLSALAVAVGKIPTTPDTALAAQLAAIAAQLASVAAAVTLIQIDMPHPPGPAVGLRLTIQEEPMASTTLSVDVTNEEVAAEWVDDKNEATSDIPAGATIAFTSSDVTIVTVGAVVASATGATAPLSFLLAGTVTLTATADDSTGAPLAGFTPGTTDLVLTAGAAAGLEVSVDQAPAVAAPPPPPAP